MARRFFMARWTNMLRFLLLIALIAPALFAADHKLKVTPETIVWGYYWADAKPVLSVKSGDTVEIQTVSGNPETLLRAGVKPEQIQPELREIYKKSPKKPAAPAGIS